VWPALTMQSMAKARPRTNSALQGDRQFAATRWSLVLAAGRRSSPESRQALETLCLTYWYPLYAYVRRRVSDVHEAQDLTQAFFASLLERDALEAADRARGRFRSFLLTAFKHFLADEWDKAKAQKRGGGRRAIPLNLESGESRFALEPADALTPERLYEKQWALTFLDHVLRRLGDEFAGKGKDKQFQALKPFLAGESEPSSYEIAARSLGISTAAAKVAAHRARRRYREILRAEIAETVSGPQEVDDEIRHLRAALG
jgi:DNA-directed RNA polymerase specialized sigma24 family protein